MNKKMHKFRAVLIITLANLLICSSIFAQSPQKMSYQAVIRNSSDHLVTNQTVGMQISILQGSVSGTAVYVETQTPTTNTNGLVSLEIGTGIVVSGDFTTIDWANGPYFIKTETDPTGSTSYTITGTSQLLSVPYALHAKTAETVTGEITESDPTVPAHVKAITTDNVSNWNDAYGWGDHSAEGYLTELSAESDPTVPAHVKAITTDNISDWNDAHDWGDHADAGYFTSEDDPTWSGAANTSSDISRTGNVGFGTDSPTQKVDVDGQIRIRGGSPGLGKILTSDANGVASWQTPTGGGGSNWSVNGNHIHYSIPSGYVGIGVSNPTAELDVAGVVNADLGLFSSSVAIGLDYVGGEAGLVDIGNDYLIAGKYDNYYHYGGAVGSDDNGLFINNSNVGVGTSTPSAQLHTTGTVRFEGAGTPGADKVLTSDASGNATWEQPSVAAGTALGQMLYWNGTEWVNVPPGNNGNVLTFVNGVPTWGGPGMGMETNDVYNPITGRIWMDRNLGASQVATSSTDADAYGDSYQWGRDADGHQLRTSSTTPNLSSDNSPGHSNFILAPNDPMDWRNPQNESLWQGVSGVNNPCPVGYRLPTTQEWAAERQSWSSQNAAGAFASPLKLPMAGGRSHINGNFINVGVVGSYWSSTFGTSLSGSNSFNTSSAYTAFGPRAYGFSVRCIKD